MMNKKKKKSNKKDLKVLLKKTYLLVFTLIINPGSILRVEIVAGIIVCAFHENRQISRNFQ